jgi:tetratricopeptide (TPR) repeat protein
VNGGQRLNPAARLILNGMAATRVRQKAKGPIDPYVGERIKELRTGAKLSQAQLAEPDFSKGFISLAETGRTRISLRAAEILAQKLGVTAADLLRRPEPGAGSNAELAVTRAQAALAAGRPEAALESLDGIKSKGAEIAPHIALIQGRALLALNRPHEALKALDVALRSYRSKGDRASSTRVLFELALVHARMDNQTEALNLGLQSEAAINDGLIVDRTFELRVMEFIAAIAVNLGDFSAADLRTERARALAEDVSDPRTLASLYENLTVTRERQGDREGALLYARKSLEAYERLADKRSLGSAWNTLGWVYVKRNQVARAREAFDRAEELGRANDDQRLLAYVLQNRAELALIRGNTEEAQRLAEASIASPKASPRCVALSRLVRAEAMAQTKATDAATTKAFDEALQALESHGRRLQARGYQSLFAAMTKRGRLKEANSAAQRALELMQPTLA